MSLGIDFTRLKNLTPERFSFIFNTLSNNHVKRKWQLIDAMLFAHDNPTYEDQLTQDYDDTKFNKASIEKYYPMARDFPITRRRYPFSPELYYTVASLRDEHGKPLTYVQDELLRKAWVHKQSGEGDTRAYLRKEVKKLRREPIIEKEKVVGKVGSIDDMLRTFHQLPDGYEVEIVIKKQQVYDSSELESETKGHAAA